MGCTEGHDRLERTSLEQRTFAHLAGYDRSFEGDHSTDFGSYSSSPRSSARSSGGNIHLDLIDNVKRCIDMHSINDDIHRYYDFEETLGHGHFGLVKSARSKTGDTETSYAIKTIPKEKITANEFVALSTEIEILALSDHPNIVKFFCTYQDDEYFHIVMEKCTGGELFDRIVMQKSFDEHTAAKIIKQIIYSVCYLHQNNICHRDIKPENFLFKSSNVNSDIKMIDFGLSKKFGRREVKEVEKIFGTNYYVAPEVLTGKYDLACDMWSVGIISYVIFSGRPPFIGKDNIEITRNIILKDPSFEDPLWLKISPTAIDFIKKLLIFEPKDRLTAHDALRHPWLEILETEPQISSEMDLSIFTKLKQYQAPGKFRKEVLSILVKFLSDDKIKDLIEAFRYLDKDETGYITYEDLKEEVMSKWLQRMPLAYEELHDIFAQFSCGNSTEEKIKYTDFIIATLDRKVYMNKKLIWNVFNYIDVDNTGFLSRENVTKAFHMEGHLITEEEVMSIMEIWDTTRTGKIMFDEFYNELTRVNKGKLSQKNMVQTREKLQVTQSTPQIEERKAENLIKLRKANMIHGYSQETLEKMAKESESLMEIEVNFLNLTDPEKEEAKSKSPGKNYGKYIYSPKSPYLKNLKMSKALTNKKALTALPDSRSISTRSTLSGRQSDPRLRERAENKRKTESAMYFKLPSSAIGSIYRKYNSETFNPFTGSPFNGTDSEEEKK